jgi:50S ribosomal protein L16 3-hydroxylase
MMAQRLRCWDLGACAVINAPTANIVRMNLDTPWLGGLSPDHFMQRVWQRKPHVMRGAITDGPFIRQRELLALASRGDVESRLIQRTGTQWTLQHGPFKRRALPPLTQRQWTLLVQGVDLHDDAAHQLLQRFSFVPWARLDDVMMSLATDGGGVGPHTDAYDVFLLQLEGQRRWRIGPVAADEQQRFKPNKPLKLLRSFKPTQTVTLDPGDMLYVPPGWGHDGVAVGLCTTASIGFRAPLARELVADVLTRIVDAEQDDAGAPSPRFSDARGQASRTPGAIPAALTAFALKSLQDAMDQPDALALALGETLTEPKPNVVFEPASNVHAKATTTRTSSPARGTGWVLDRRTRMLYDAQFVFINGESFAARGRDAQAMRHLADHRRLTLAQAQKLSQAAASTLRAWQAAGWLHAAPDTPTP